jgi:lysozyme
MKVTQINEAGVGLIKKWEGFKSKPYLCPAGVPTIGYGTTRYPWGKKVSLNDGSINKNQAESCLMNDVRSFELSVDSLCRDDLTSNQFSAIVSFCYNLGATALRRSTLLKKINANPNAPDISKEFLKWVYAGGRKLKGLENRRKEEVQLYFNN